MFLLYKADKLDIVNENVYNKVIKQLEKSNIQENYYKSLNRHKVSKFYTQLERRNNFTLFFLIASMVLNGILLYMVLRRRKKNDTKTLKTEKLTSKEIQILQLISTHKTNKEIAEELYISNATVKTHINNIYRKLGIKSRQEAILYNKKST